MRIVIIANGDPPTSDALAHWLREGSALICADGGARVALSHGLKPAHVIGDFDSLSEADLRTLEAGGAQLHRYSPRKDETDLELALSLAARLLADDPQPEIVILGAVGGRLDHELANIMLLAMPALRGIKICLVHGRERVLLLDARDGPSEVVLEGRAGDVVSLLPFGGDAHGIRTSGLEYPLNDEPLLFGPARGVSNVMLGSQATIALRQGMLLCIQSTG